MALVCLRTISYNFVTMEFYLLLGLSPPDVAGYYY
jgi:hypothetical protein